MFEQGSKLERAIREGSGIRGLAWRFECTMSRNFTEAWLKGLGRW